MPNPTPKKVAGKVTPPPSQADFNKRPLGKYCRSVTGMFRRLHVINPATHQPWPPIYFSSAGNTRFDPVGGIGTMCVGESLGGAILEKFDDRFGPEGDDSRSLTETELRETWETLMYLPSVQLFDATGKNLSLIRADAQFAVGEYSITREWALRISPRSGTKKYRNLWPAAFFQDAMLRSGSFGAKHWYVERKACRGRRTDIWTGTSLEASSGIARDGGRVAGRHTALIARGATRRCAGL